MFGIINIMNIRNLILYCILLIFLIGCNPTDEMPHVKQGMYFRKKGEFKNAISEFTKAIEINPKNGIAYNLRAMSWAELKDFDQAISDFTEAIRINPNDGYTYTLRGIALCDTGAYRQSLSDFDTAIKINSKNVFAHTNKCSVSIILKQYEEACSYCQHACELGDCNGLRILKGFCN